MPERYVVTNAPTFHVTTQDGPDGKALCGFTYTATKASVVTQPPRGTFTACKKCGARSGR